jgi:hypothetical protein
MGNACCTFPKGLLVEFDQHLLDRGRRHFRLFATSARLEGLSLTHVERRRTEHGLIVESLQ